MIEGIADNMKFQTLNIQHQTTNIKHQKGGKKP